MPRTELPRTFRLIGHATVFRLVREYKAAGYIPSVYGHTLDGKMQTYARVADIKWLTGDETPEGLRALRAEFRALRDSAYRQMGLRYVKDALALKGRNSDRITALAAAARNHLQHARAVR